VETTTMTPNNIYILNDIEEQRYYLGKEYESCILQRRMVHTHFDNIFKINNNQVV
jgi:hypothetical protein